MRERVRGMSRPLKEEPSPLSYDSQYPFNPRGKVTEGQHWEIISLPIKQLVGENNLNCR